MKEGFWINYQTGKIFKIDEHERWIRDVSNARKLGVPEKVIARFYDFKPSVDRVKFLSFVMKKAPVMRIRGHGVPVTIEFWAWLKSKPMDAIRLWAEKNAGALTVLDICNMARGTNVRVPYADLQRYLRPKPRSKKASSTKSANESSCPLPLSTEERKKIVAVWLKGIPAEIRKKVEGLNVVEVGIGMGPSCVGVYIKKLKSPGKPLLVALDWLAGQADLMRRCHVVLSDGQTLGFEPHQFFSYGGEPVQRVRTTRSKQQKALCKNKTVVKAKT